MLVFLLAFTLGSCHKNGTETEDPKSGSDEESTAPAEEQQEEAPEEALPEEIPFPVRICPIVWPGSEDSGEFELVSEELAVLRIRRRTDEGPLDTVYTGTYTEEDGHLTFLVTGEESRPDPEEDLSSRYVPYFQEQADRIRITEEQLTFALELLEGKITGEELSAVLKEAAENGSQSGDPYYGPLFRIGTYLFGKSFEEEADPAAAVFSGTDSLLELESGEKDGTYYTERSVFQTLSKERKEEEYRYESNGDVPQLHQILTYEDSVLTQTADLDEAGRTVSVESADGKTVFEYAGESGTPEKELFYRDGELLRLTVFGPEGEVLSEEIHEEGTSVTDNYENGILVKKETVSEEDGTRDTEIYENGALAKTETVSGTASVTEEFFASGEKKSHTETDADGNVWERFEWDEAGHLLYKQTEGSNFVMLYTYDGNTLVSDIYHDINSGTDLDWREYDKEGHLVHVVEACGGQETFLTYNGDYILHEKYIYHQNDYSDTYGYNETDFDQNGKRTEQYSVTYFSNGKLKQKEHCYYDYEQNRILSDLYDYSLNFHSIGESTYTYLDTHYYSYYDHGYTQRNCIHQHAEIYDLSTEILTRIENVTSEGDLSGPDFREERDTFYYDENGDFLRYEVYIYRASNRQMTESHTMIYDKDGNLIEEYSAS